MNRNGSGLRNVPQKPQQWKIFGLAWSPDGRRIAVAIQERFREASQIWLVNADGTRKRKLTTAAGENLGPVWSPDGERIAFSSERDGNSEIYVMNADDSEQTRLTHNTPDDFFPAWSYAK
jgi:TolB protein